MFELSTATVLYGEQSLERACREIASVGIRYVDLWHVAGWCEHLAGGVEAVAETLGRHGLRLQAVTAFRASTEELSALLPIVRQLGGSALVTFSSPATVPLAAYAEEIRPLVEQATDLGLTLAVENHRGKCVDSIASMVELCERLPAAGLGIALAPIHLHVRRESTERAIRALRERIALFYLWDWGPTADRNWKDPAEQFFGTGVIDFEPVLPALAEVGHRRPLDVFAHGAEHWPPEMATNHLRQAIARARRLMARIQQEAA